MAYCIIKYIEREKLEPSVGVGDNNPSIKYLKNGHEKDTEPDNIEFGDYENDYISYKERFIELK